MKTKKVPHATVEYKSVSQTIKNRHEALMEAHTSATIQRIASLNFDSLNEKASMKNYLGGVQNGYQQLPDYLDQHIQGSKVLEDQKRDEADTAEKTQELTTNMQEKQNQLKILKARLDEKAKKFQSVISRWKIWRLVTMLLCFLELLFNYEVFFSFGGNLLVSIGTAVLMALSIYLYSHFVPEKVKLYGKGDIRKELGFFVLYLIPITLVFNVLATLRLNFLTVMNDGATNSFNLSPWVFILVNVFAYLICYWIVYKHKPTKQESNRYSDYQKGQAEIQAKEKEIRDLKEQLSALEPALRKRTGQRQSILLLGKQLEDEIQTAYEQCLAEIKLELMLRTNGAVIPLYNRGHLLPLKFNYQSIHLPS